ncbi:hypothetical protein RvY_13194 [Ramazzottius varieornatus]|uniref:Molybdopterin synthase catalytic subunit n=1 Tax=Ramazzottius varieornatus TaxID=947166 RepID=A0A1D1VM38_RAMVA|nr:hypothetical protein RvY_13194 [Ramazzottius varieornatus]
MRRHSCLYRYVFMQLQKYQLTTVLVPYLLLTLSLGTSRSTSRQSEKPVIALDYQAYIPMAEHQLKKICADMRQKNLPHMIGNIVLAHRVGYVPIGHPGLFVGVSAPHRKEAIESMDWAIFQIKAKVPVWKQEVYEDQTRAWTVNCECYWLSPSSQTPNNEATTGRFTILSS